MRIAFGLGHPAHYHLYKNLIQQLQSRHEITVFISDKDVLRKLLDSNNISYFVIATSKTKENLIVKAKKLIFSSYTLYRHLRNKKPDIIVSCITQLCWVGRLLNRNCIFNAEDDISYTYLQGIITYPFVNTILASNVVKTWPFSYKKIGYSGYHKLAYLHPNWFVPNINIKEKYIKESNYVIIRMVSQSAYHDINARGLDINTISGIITSLKQYGAIYISSEKPLPDELKEYALSINENDIHHILYYANLFIGDSQTMVVECAMLGTPSIRINNFANKISIIKEIESEYQLTYSFLPSQKDCIIPQAKKILTIKKDIFKEKRMDMIKQKIDVTSFFVWFIENYPQSVQVMKENPDYQYNFR